MSGDAGGAIIGLALALAAAPAIIAGAAVIGTAYAVIKGGAFLAMKAKEHHDIVQMEVDNCSNDLKRMYSSINSAINSANDLQYEYNVKVAERMKEISKEIEKISTDDSALGVWRDTLNTKQKELDKTLAISTSETATEIRSNFSKVARESISVLENEKALGSQLVNWKSKLAADTANAKAYATLSLNDAAATVKLLKNLSASSPDKELAEKVAVLSDNFARVQNAFDNGLYEASLSEANNIVTQGAVAASEFAATELERKQAVLEYQTRLTSLKAELEKRRYLTVTLECGETNEVDLADFSQGMYEKALDELERKLEQSEKEWDNISLEKVRAELSAVDIIEIESGEVSVAKIIDVSTDKMRSYYEKLAALEIVSDYMESQGFILQWARPVSDDLSQKLVVGFSNSTTKNTVSVSIDTDGKIEDMCNYVMELAYFYNNERPVTEQEKDNLRQGLNEALSAKGLRGMLGCTGSYDKPSEKKELATETEVKNSVPVNIYNG